jgi:2-polyprenyl-3-methyl-5-hydroxy-6-metoxy-1,4-benzoquinol methylase
MIDQARLEQTACPLCGSQENRRLYEFAPFAVVRCAGCRLYYLTPRVSESDLIRHYSRDYFAGGDRNYADYSGQEAALRITFRQLLRQMAKRELTGGALLEIGCGYGYLLDEAGPFFDRRVGTDFSPQAAAQANQKADRVYAGGIEQVRVGESFNCIIATQVIEHVYQPIQFLESLRGHLVKGGSLLLTTPNMGGFWRRLMGRRWPSLKIPQHVQFFEKQTLSALLRHAGFSDVQTIPHPHAFPAKLVAEKLKFSIPAPLEGINIWIPSTTIAVYGIRA